MGTPLPSIDASTGTIPVLVRKLNELIRVIEQRFTATERVGNDQGYAVSNVTTTRTFDANTATVSDLADVIGTLIADLQKSGAIK